MLRVLSVQFHGNLVSGRLLKAACRRKAEFAFALFELKERQFVMLCNELAAL